MGGVEVVEGYFGEGVVEVCVGGAAEFWGSAAGNAVAGCELQHFKSCS